MTTASPRLHRLVAAFDRGLLQLAPAWAASRAQSRVKAVAYRQAYEAAEKPTCAKPPATLAAATPS